MSLTTQNRDRSREGVSKTPASDDVVFDLVFEDGLLFFELSNREAAP